MGFFLSLKYLILILAIEGCEGTDVIGAVHISKVEDGQKRIDIVALKEEDHFF